MTSTNNQNRDQTAPLQLMEPDLAAWAEKITIDSTNDRRGLWYGAALFWIVVAAAVAHASFTPPAPMHPLASLPPMSIVTNGT